jgi:hypothetical protein
VSDLVVFVGILALVAVVGVLIGIIVAGRIDRLMSPRPVAKPDGGQPEEEQP